MEFVVIWLVLVLFVLLCSNSFGLSSMVRYKLLLEMLCNFGWGFCLIKLLS